MRKLLLSIILIVISANIVYARLGLKYKIGSLENNQSNIFKLNNTLNYLYDNKQSIGFTQYTTIPTVNDLGDNEMVHYISGSNYRLYTKINDSLVYMPFSATNVLLTTSTYSQDSDKVDGYHLNQNVLTTSTPTFGGALINGNVGIGLTNPDVKLDVYGNMQIFSGQVGYSPALNFGHETSTQISKCLFLDNYWLNIQGHRDQGINMYGVNASGTRQPFLRLTGDAYSDASEAWFFSDGGGKVGINNSAPANALTVTGTLDVTGNIGIGKTNPTNRLYVNNTSGVATYITNSADNQLISNFQHSGTAPYGLVIGFSGAAPNNTSQYFLQCEDTEGAEANIFSDGSFVQVSDERLKTDIKATTNQLNKIVRISVKDYKRIGDITNKEQTGLIAQELLEIYPDLVCSVSNGIYENKMINYIGLIPKLIKAFQEQQEQINSLIKRIEALENK